MNLNFMKNDYPPGIIKKGNRLIYYEILDRIHTTGNYTEFIKFIIKVETKMLEKCLKLM